MGGEQTHVLYVAPTANVQALRAQLSLLEGVDAEQLNLFCSGAPLEDEVSLAFLENQAVDPTIPLKGGKVHGSSLVPERSEARPPRSRLVRRRRRRLDAPRGGSSMSGGSERCRDLRRSQEGT